MLGKLFTQAVANESLLIISTKMNIEFGSQVIKSYKWELTHYINNLFFTWHIMNIKLSCNHFVSNEVHIYFNMLCSWMINMIPCQFSSSNIITPNYWFFLYSIPLALWTKIVTKLILHLLTPKLYTHSMY